MSMVIIGENPPKNCYVCSWYNKVQCPVNDGRCYYRVQRHPNCPLIELPPHGRLIDEDEIEIPCLETTADQKWMEIAIKSTPTVIETEGSET